MALGPEHVGSRVVVRRLCPGELGLSGGPAMTDILGRLDSITEAVLVVRRDDGSISHLVCETFVYTRTPYDPAYYG